MNDFTYKQFLPNLISGIVISFLSVTTAISYMVLIFPESLQNQLSIGIAIGLIGVIVLNFVIALKSRSQMLARQQIVFVVLMMIMVKSTVELLDSQGHHSQILPTIIVLIAVSTLLTGISLFLLGYFKKGSLVRFVPYPIMVSFVAGTSWLTILGSFKVMTDLEVSAINFFLIWHKQHIFHLLAGIFVAIILIVVEKNYKHFLAIPFTILSLFIAFHLFFWLTNLSAQGWFLGTEVNQSVGWPLLSFSDFFLVNWPAIAGQSFHLAVLIFTFAISLLLNIMSFELIMQKNIDVNQELKVGGIANIVTGFFGGLGGCQSFAFSNLGLHLQVDNRLVCLITSFITLLLYFIGLDLISYFPKALLGGLLFYTGFDLLFKGIYENWYKLPKIDYALMLGILFIIIYQGFLEGVILGVFIAVVLFVFQYSRINVIKHSLSGRNFQSRVDRSLEQQHFLREQGDAIYILQLQGFLFFGTSYGIIEQIQQRLALLETLSLQFIIMDFSLVTGLDASSVLTFPRLKQIAQQSQCKLVFTNLSAEIQRRIKKINIQDDQILYLFPTLDEGLDWCEQQLLKKSSLFIQQAKSNDLFSWIKMPECQLYFEKIQFATGEYLLYQNSQSDDLYFIEAGQVSAILELANKKTLRLRTMTAGAIVGELSFYLHIPRTASVIAEQPTFVYKLTQEAFTKMKDQHPHIAGIFQEYLIGILAERVYQANETIQMIIH